MAHEAAQRRDRALHRPAPVGVLGDHGRGLPEPRRLHVVGAVLGEAEDGGRGARLRVDVERQRRRPADPGHAQDREVVLRVEPDGLGVERRPLAAELDRRVVLARDHVRVRHDDAAAGDPAAPLDAEAAGGAQHAHHAPPGRPHVGVAGDLRVRRRHVRGGAADRRERVEARERLQDRPRRRQRRVQPLEDLGALDRLAQLARAGRLERHGARDPDEEEPEAGHEHRRRPRRRATPSSSGSRPRRWKPTTSSTEANTEPSISATSRATSGA